MQRSPITNTTNTKLICSISPKDILKSYEEIGICNIDKYFKNVDSIDIHECLDTGYRFYAPFNIFGDDEFYEYLQEQRKYYSEWRWEHGIAYDEIKESDSILEIGCGDGNFLKKVSKKTTRVKGLEYNQKAIKKALSRELDVTNESVQEFAENNEERYDGVCFFQVLEHISEINSFLSAAIKALKKGGKLIIGVPNNNPYLYRHDKLHALNLPPHHAGLWNKESLKEIQNVYHLMLIKQEVEPLVGDIDYFWDVQTKYWKDNGKMRYFLSELIPSRNVNARNAVIKKFYEGRNIISVYEKL